MLVGLLPAPTQSLTPAGPQFWRTTAAQAGVEASASRVLVTQQAGSTDRQRRELLEELLEGQGFAAAQTQWGAMLALYAQGAAAAAQDLLARLGPPSPWACAGLLTGLSICAGHTVEIVPVVEGYGASGPQQRCRAVEAHPGQPTPARAGFPHLLQRMPVGGREVTGALLASLAGQGAGLSPERDFVAVGCAVLSRSAPSRGRVRTRGRPLGGRWTC